MSVGYLSRRTRSLLVGAVVAVAAVAWLGADLKGSVADRAERWAEGGIPAIETLEDLAAYPEIYRIQIIRRLDPEVKSRLWREQISRFLASAHDLDDAQVRFLRSLIVRATPEAMEQGGGEAGICKEFTALFPIHSKVPIAKPGNLGAFDRPRFSWSSLMVKGREAVAGFVSAQADGGLCNCYNAGWCECTGSDECCQTSPGTGHFVCITTSTGCGCFWEDDHGCNGQCMRASSCWQFQD